MAAVAAGRRRPVVVGNGAEGEPASGKDKCLLWLAPHLVLDGLQLAADAVGARSVYLYVSGGRLHERLTGAIAERTAAGCDPRAVRLITGPPRFLAGEESALVSLIDGGRRGRLSSRRVSSNAVSAARRRSCRTWRPSPMWRSSPGMAPRGSAGSAPRTNLAA